MSLFRERPRRGSRIIAAFLGLGLAVSAPHAASAQAAPGAPAVGVVEVAKRSITEKTEFLGRIEAINRVNVVARVTAFMEKRLFTEGAEVSSNDQLYLLERGPFQADLDAKRAQVSLSQINLDYTDIRSPIDGKIARTSVTEGNVVSPTTGTLTTIVSQDPMYVTFPVSMRQALVLRERYAAKGIRDAVVIALKLPDGRIYGQTGHLDFESNSLSQTTDTLLLRGKIPNPPLYSVANPVRELTDGELVTVVLEGAEPVEVPAIPRAAVLSDQQGNYVLVLGAENKVEQRRIQVGQSTTTIASVTTGLSLGDKVIVEGIQRTRPGQVVTPGPVSEGFQAAMNQAERGRPEQGGSPRGNTSSAQHSVTQNGG